MASPRRFRAPAGDGAVLADPDFAAVPGLVAENRRRLDRADVVIGGLPLRALRALARREALEFAESPPVATGGLSAPLILAGHQPELSHPGVWVKHFALNGLARKLDGIPLNLVVDNDTLKSTALRLPVFRDRDPASVHLEPGRFDALDGEVPYEDRPVLDSELFATFADRAAPLWANWGYEPLLSKVWASGGRKPPEYASRFDSLQAHSGCSSPSLAGSGLIGDRFTAMRRHCEREWGCHNLELPVSRLSQTDAFRHFAAHVLRDLPRFREVYNAAIRSYRVTNGVRSANHPAPELAPGEAPFWVRTTAGRRAKATAASDVTALRPRALTLTLFARVCVGDFFIHGIGGGKYDEVTDAIIRDYFGIDPPAYQVLSATLHLPLPGFPTTSADVEAAERRVRDLTWNPQRHLRAAALTREKEALTAAEPSSADHSARREWFNQLRGITDRLRPLVADQLAAAVATLARCRAEDRANAVLRRRDYSWVLYPETTLRPFLQRFLDVP